jgi:hypothetical protein
MDQSRYGVIRVMEEAQAHPLIVAPPKLESPHASIDPSALRAAKAPPVE